MINICFCIHDIAGTYSKYLGTAICSVLENTNSEICFFIIHDETLKSYNKENICKLINKYNCKVEFCLLDASAFDEYAHRVDSFTIGSLFRLKLINVLSHKIKKIIYLDVDVIVNMDIKELWSVDLEGHMIAACLDEEISSNGNTWTCKNRLLESQTYVNSGVLVINIEEIRKKVDLEKECFAFLKKYPKCELSDQDALNFVFKNKILVLDRKYNKFTRKCNNEEDECIYHYAGSNVDFEEKNIWDNLFIKYFLKTPWGTNDNILNMYEYTFLNKKHAILVYRRFINLFLLKKKKIIWGAGSVMLASFLSFVSLDYKRDYLIDNNKEIQGKTISNMIVYSPDKIKNEQKEDVLVIVLSKKYYNIISKQLNGYGFVENEDYIDGRMLMLQKEGGYNSQDCFI